MLFANGSDFGLLAAEIALEGSRHGDDVLSARPRDSQLNRARKREGTPALGEQLAGQLLQVFAQGTG